MPDDLTEVERLELLVAGLRAANATLREECKESRRKVLLLGDALRAAEADRDRLQDHIWSKLPRIDLNGLGTGK